MKRINRSDIQVIFQLYGHFICLQVLYSKYNSITKYCLTQWILKLPGAFKSLCKAVPVKFTGLVGIVNATIYKPIVACFGHGNLS